MIPSYNVFQDYITWQEPRQAIFLMKKGLKSIQNMINGLCHKLSSNDMACPYNLGLHHWPVCIVLTLIVVPCLNKGYKTHN